MENVFLDVECENDVFGNRLEFVLPRMTYLLDNNNFQTALYFKPFCMMMFLERSVYFWTGVVLQNTGMMHLQHMQMHVDVDEFIFVYLLQLEFATNSGEQCACMHVPGSSMLHDRIKETRTTLHSGRQSQDKLPLLVLCVARKR